MDVSSTEHWLPPREADESMEDWTARLREDMQGRWEGGNPVRVEMYTRTFPELADDSEAVLDLIAQERLLRAEAGETPAAEEYVALYPGWEAEIRAQFAVEEGLTAIEELVEIEFDSGSATSIQQGATAIPQRFRFIRLLGQGGFGRVGLYRDTVHNRPVAIKEVRPELTMTEDRFRHLERFCREADVAAGLNHPNICTLYEHALDRTPPYLVFEYVDGVTLRDILDEESLFAVLDAVQIIRDVANGMAHCHKKGQIHRDLKPENIKRRSDGVIKVLDLGLARPFDPARQLVSDSNAIPGTLIYSSPEQIDAPMSIGPASDQFSLGIVFYELLTGQRPFPGKTVGQVIAQVQNQPATPPRQHRPELDDAIISIVLRMLEKKPGDRFGSMDEVRRVLDDYLAGNRQPVPRRQHWSRRELVVAGGGLAALLAASAAAVWRWLPSPGKKADTDTRLPPPPPEAVPPAADLAVLLGRIATDLARFDEQSQPYQRYLSLAHLANDTRVSPEQIRQVRDGLDTLLPKLAHDGDPVGLEPVAGDASLLRLDLRRLGWEPGWQWEEVIRHYPYSLRYRAGDLQPGVRAAGSTIAKLLDTDLTPFLLADWFAATASAEPLATDLLKLTFGEEGPVQARHDEIRGNLLLTQLREHYARTPVDLRRASLELGLSDPERLKKLLMGKDELKNRLGVGAWLDEGGTIPRSHWLRFDLEVAPFGELATELNLGIRRLLR